MSVHQDEAKRLRIRDTVMGVDFSQSGRDPTLGMPCVVVQTKTIATYPNVAQSFYACSPLTILGPEIEGGGGIIAQGTSIMFALNLGTVVPPTGSNILATFVDNRWIFRYDG